MIMTSLCYSNILFHVKMWKTRESEKEIKMWRLDEDDTKQEYYCRKVWDIDADVMLVLLLVFMGGYARILF